MQLGTFQLKVLHNYRFFQVKSRKKEHQSYFDMLRKYIPPWMQYVGHYTIITCMMMSECDIIGLPWRENCSCCMLKASLYSTGFLISQKYPSCLPSVDRKRHHYQNSKRFGLHGYVEREYLDRYNMQTFLHAVSD